MSVNNSDLICLIMFWVITLKWAYDIGHRNSYHEEALKRIDEIGNKSNQIEVKMSEELKAKNAYLSHDYKEKLGYLSANKGTLQTPILIKMAELEFAERQAMFEHENKKLRELFDCQAAQVKILREALEFYANRKNCDNPESCFVYEIDSEGDEIADEGYTARQALAEIDKMNKVVP